MLVRPAEKVYADDAAITLVKIAQKNTIDLGPLWPAQSLRLPNSTPTEFGHPISQNWETTVTTVATVPRIPEGGESFKIEFDHEEDGRWIAEIPDLPGVMAYGETKQDAEVKVTALALRVLADRTEQAKKPPKSIRFL